MEIRPYLPGGVPQKGAERLDESRAASTPGGGTPPPATRPNAGADRAELSGEAVALERGLGDRAGATLAPDRMQTVLERLTGGYYDRPEVQAAVVSRIAGELGLDPTER